MKTIEALNDSIDILRTYPLKSFVKVTDTPILASKLNNSNTFIFMVRPPLKTQELRFELTQSLEFDNGLGALLGLNSGPDFLCGYVIKFRPNIQVQYNPFYITSVKQSKEGDKLPVSHVLNLENLSLYKIGVDYMAATINKELVNHLT